jgi:RHH-type proline utilization regulon transcriptional repressor/proline dehydrogenase/delta 1-pyrroline-5-carboxylate dehydrogenase
MEKIKNRLNRQRGIRLSEEERVKASIEIAFWLQKEAQKGMTLREKKIQEEISGMISDEKGKAFFMQMTDQCFRTTNNRRCADQILYLLKKYGIPSYLSWDKKIKLRLFSFFGFLAPFLVPLIKKTLRKETSHVILPSDPKSLVTYLKEMKKSSVSVNLNRLGEALLGEEEAKRRLDLYLEDLKDPLIETISVKISTLSSQIKVLSFHDTLERLKEPYRRLLREASLRKKMVNLDMEDFHDLQLTVTLFQEVLEEAEFFQCSSGIALQAYVRESFLIQQKLTLFAQDRVSKGGAPIKIRLVKGANLAQERVNASLSGWQLPLYSSKEEVDRNFKRMLEYALQENRVEAVHIGVASHNIFDIAYALLLRSENGCERFVTFEMLQGMNDSLRRVVTEVSQDMLVYSPIGDIKEFQFAIAYLIRRLDENTGPQNFLRYAFHLVPGSAEWNLQKEAFSSSCFKKNELPFTSSRLQNRLIDPPFVSLEEPFVNEPNTDFTLVENQLWAEKVLKEAFVETPQKNSVVFSKKNALEMSSLERADLLIKVAHLFKKNRGRLIGVMVLETKKVFEEADAEVSEAIDFLGYYARSLLELEKIPGFIFEPKGVVLVTPPWNFPCSIPTGGVAASFAAGNSVILKPAPEAVRVGFEIYKLFVEAGIPKDLLQFTFGTDEEVGEKLLLSSEVNTVLLTGSTETAKKMLNLRPGLDLIAETGGKNALIVTALSDRELAIKHSVASAFHHAGQKCSALSLLILEAEVYDSQKFMSQLKDAAQSLAVGSPLDLKTVVNPLIAPPQGALLKAYSELEEGEEWLLEPTIDPKDPCLMSPGIKLGVKKGSFMHQTELFGPILAVMRAQNLEEAIEFANGTPYGLTSGLFSLDEREQTLWKERIEACNLYINRGITGAIVLRQPFGGYKASNFGSGYKSGGENTLLGFMKVKDVEKGPYDFKPKDPLNLIGQKNIFYYIPKKNLCLRVQEGDLETELIDVLESCRLAGALIEVSSPYPCPFLKKYGNKIVVEDEDSFFERSASFKIRFLRKPKTHFLERVSRRGQMVTIARPLANQRLEMLHSLQEVSLSFDDHRYGNLGERC